MSEAANGAAQATPPVQTTQTTTAAPNNTGAELFSGIADPELRAKAAAKFTSGDYTDLAKGWANAEKAIGDKVPLPKLDDPEAVKAHLVKLGAPADGKYELKIEEGIAVDEGLKGAFEGEAAKLGLLPHQAQGLLDFWNAAAKEAGAAQAKTEEAAQKAKDDALAAYQTEIGKDNFESTLADAQRAQALAGFKDEVLNAMETLVPGGTKNFIEGMARLGRLGTEDQYVEGHGAKAPRSEKPLAQRLWPNLPPS